MSEADKHPKPWEISPDESYWQALLREGEYSEHDNHHEPDRVVDAGADTYWSASALPVAGSTPDAPLPVARPDSAYAAPDRHQVTGWDEIRQYYENDEWVELPVTGFNRGGLLVDWNGIRGFVPASQIDTHLAHRDEQQRSAALAARVGSTMNLKVVECDPDQKRLILSERASRALIEPDYALLKTLCPGDVCRGRVTNLCSFGAFVDLGGIEGLIHISELSWGRVSRPGDVLQNDQELDVYILSVDPDHGRVSLSLKRLQPDPWEAVEQRYHEGAVVKGIVTSIVSFGAFVRLEEGLEGLIHISRLRNDSGEMLPIREHQVIQVKIKNINGTQHRIGLDLEPSGVAAS